MQFKKETDGSLKELPKMNVDFGGGLERMLAAVVGDPDVFKTDLFDSIIQKIEDLSAKKYIDPEHTPSFRVIADHIKAAVMLAADGVYPDNKEQGYFARRLVRRAIRHGKKLGINKPFVVDLVSIVANIYKDAYPEVTNQLSTLENVLRDEEQKFLKTLNTGLREFEKVVDNTLTAQNAFFLFETYGFPLELSLEEAVSRQIKLENDIDTKFLQAKKSHADLSRTASAGMFKGGLADHSETVTKLHTATHLLHKALRNVLGTHVRQEGSNITAERLRFDFAHTGALTPEEISKVEAEINEQIQKNLTVTKTIENRDKALATGAMAFFKDKYPEEVSVYTIGDNQNFYSKEFCGGPHVSSTGVIGTVKITKQEAVGAGKRRIYAVIAN